MRSHAPWIAVAAGLCVMVACAPQTGGSANQNLANDAMNEGVSVAAGFTIATRVGTSTGQQEAAVCEGWFPLEPNHTVTIEGGLNMTVTLVGASDPRLWILCGESHFCGAETAENTWTINRFWTAGTCEVYVGAPSEGEQLQYTLEFLEE